MREAEKCLLCDNKSSARGLCKRCYSSARKKVADRTISWDKLVGMGLARPLQEKSANPFTAALNNALTETSDG